MPRTYVSTPAIDRFEAKYIPEPNSGCWLWTGACLRQGYGAFGADTRRSARAGLRSRRAHCFAWEHYRGPIPEGLHVLHKCDVPGCVNPDHLFLGTAADNAADKVAKRRQTRGETAGMARLSEADVREIRAHLSRAWGASRRLAEAYGVSEATISMIRSGKRWRHV